MSTPTEKQIELFEILHNSRVEDYKVFSKRDYGGMFRSVVDKYPDSAHFIYELLQNADDANAKEVYIILKKDCLIFKHNGTKHFDVTPLDSDEVGDINSITGIGNSTKTDTQNKIGKFGVGFKSVFKYTDTPEIYDDTFHFKIENYIIPTLLPDDAPERLAGETMFVFHFKEGKERDAFNSIKEKLYELQSPILFLHSLKKIVWRIDDGGKTGQEYSYEMRLLGRTRYNDISCERCLLIEPNGTSNIFLFSEEIAVTDEEDRETSHQIYVGFFYDAAEVRLITNETRNIHCFFPTDNTFNTCFITHAPFLLTENRTSLNNANEECREFNKQLIVLLAKLAARAIVILRDYGIKHKHLLIDENITEIIKSYRPNFSGQFHPLFQQPFINAFRQLLKTEPLLLSRNNKYLHRINTYFTRDSVYELLDSKQFQTLRGDDAVDFAKWELAKNIQIILENGDDCNYYNGVLGYSIGDFGDDITAEFMDEQSVAWVTKFYTFLREDASKYLNLTSQSKNSTLVFRSKAPIIKTQNDEWVAPYADDNVTPNVYLPIKGGTDQSSGYNFVNSAYMKEEMAKKLFNQLELKQPDEFDYIRNVLLDKYEDGCDIDDDVLRDDFYVLLTYYQKVANTTKADDFISILKEKLFLVSDDDHLNRPYKMYLSSSILRQYFGNNTDVLFFNMSFYKNRVKEFKNSFINDFICLLGVHSEPFVGETETTYHNMPQQFLHLIPPSRRYYYELVRVNDYDMFGFEEACGDDISKEVSVYLWNEIFPKYRNTKGAVIRASTHRRSTWDLFYSESKFTREIKTLPWIYNKEGRICFAEDVFLEDLDPAYHITNGVADMLGIEKKTPDLQEKYGATAEEQKIFEKGAEYEAMTGDLTEEEEKRMKQAMERERERILRERESATSTTEEEIEEPQEKIEEPQEDEDIEEKLNRKWEEKKNRFVNKPHSKTLDSTELPIEPFNNETPSTQNDAPFFTKPSSNENQNEETDDTARAEKNLKAKDTTAQAQAENAKEQVEILNLLKETPEYTFKWFKVLMELMHAGQDKLTERRVQIDFSHHEMICSDKILHLTEPTLPVPSWCCDAEKYSLDALSDGKRTKIDCQIVRTEDDSLDVSVELDNRLMMALQEAKKIRLIAIDNTNIIDSLETRFLQLDKEDDYDMNANLPEGDKISFIYGPPGTGKTTELVRQVHDILEREPEAKILVLTPTNKAADVVAIKMSNDDVCYNYLARYGATESLYLIEDIGCLTNRDTTDMSIYNIVVATAARYAYDFLQPNDVAICDYLWDYIFIDEASMIDILTITYILHKGADAKQIIISGDPKQIQPVVQNDMPAYNVYDMVKLHGFADAINEYDRFPVIPLMVQHRSVPTIGNMVSKFAYDGLVEYDPQRAPQKPLKLDGFNIKNINFAGYRIEELDDIKGLSSIGNSAFQLYSAIFTYNMIEYVIKQIGKNHPGQEYSIGVVSAYRAQSDAIKNMIENRPLDTLYCKVSCGTVHSFQGDECDIMFIVLNPPPICTKGAHINNENIINVAMSRVRDYIFFIIPQGQQPGFRMKNRLGDVSPFSDRTVLDCAMIEKVMFGNENFIYENTHVTCHMPVNVYCEDSAIYEVRLSEEALDIRINMK